jgi:hypothetical protein
MNKNTAFYRNNQIFEYSFDAEHISTDGAILLTKKIAQNSGLLSSFSHEIHDKRNTSLIDFKVDDFVNQRVLMMLQGYEDCNDAEKLNHDPLIEAVLGNRLASQPTLSRFENSLNKFTIYRLCHWYANRYVNSLSPGRKEIIIDVDGTDDPTHGQQQLSFYNGYYDTSMYMEIFFKDGNTGQVIVPLLLPGYYNSSRLFVAVLRRLVDMIRSKLPGVKIIIRADGAYSKPEFYDLVNEKQLYYGVGLSSNSVLKKLIAPQEKFIREVILPTCKQFKCVSLPFEYKASTWENPEQVYARFEVTAGRLDIRYIASNMGKSLYDGNDLYWNFYAQRGEASENRIKEIKNMCYSDRLSCHNFWANYFRLLLYCLGYELFRLIKVLIQKSGFKQSLKWQVNTIRLNLLKIGAWFKKTKRRISIHFSQSFRYRELLNRLLQLT